MATITEDYVSFEIAKLLKEKGFDEETRKYYPVKGDATGRLMDGSEYPHNHSQVQICAPTLQMAMKWLRETYDVDISIIPLRSHKEYLPRIESDTISYDAIPCRKYEDACETAIKYCLENLIHVS